MKMMIQNAYFSSSDTQTLQTAILDEVVRSQDAQMVIDELGVAMATHLGSKRDRNEDRIAVARIVAPNAETYTVALVCDGVGGSESGDQAASLAITSIIVDLAKQRGRTYLEELAIALIRGADDLVRKELYGRGATTLVMLLGSSGGQFVCANVGDSRAYRWDQDLSQLNQVTIDDTIENELKYLPGNPAALINAHGLQGRLSQAIGESGRTAEDLRVQVYTKVHFPRGAALGSDGLWRVAKDFDAAVANAGSPTDAVRRAVALANWVGGVDNASMIAARDVGLFCRSQPVRGVSGSPQTQITLWLPSSKVGFMTNSWLSESKSVRSPRAKPEKQRGSTKKKVKRETENELQLKLETVDAKEARPQIEVMITKETKKLG